MLHRLPFSPSALAVEDLEEGQNKIVGLWALPRATQLPDMTYPGTVARSDLELHGFSRVADIKRPGSRRTIETGKEVKSKDCKVADLLWPARRNIDMRRECIVDGRC